MIAVRPSLGYAAAAILLFVTLPATGRTAVAASHSRSRNPHASERTLISTLIRQRYASQGAEVRIGSMQVLARVEPCPDTPVVTTGGNGAYQTAHVRCPALGWQFYIPVTVRTRGTVVVAAHDLLPGEPLRASDLRLLHTPNLPAAVATAHSERVVIGKTLSVPIARGEPISLTQLAEPVVVHSGQNVTIRIEAGNVTVTTAALALQNGRIGQSIIVKNPHTGKRYHVTVEADGSAEYVIGRG